MDSLASNYNRAASFDDGTCPCEPASQLSYILYAQLIVSAN